MFLAAEASRIWTLTPDRIIPFFRNLDDAASAAAKMDKKPKNWEFIDDKGRADYIGTYYMRQSYRNKERYPPFNFIIFHADKGTVPAYSYFTEPGEVRYPILCI